MLRVESQASGLRDRNTFSFSVIVERIRKDKTSYVDMDFPLYVLDGPSNDIRNVHDLMRAHGYPQTYRGEDMYTYASNNWRQGSADYGIGLPADFREKQFVRLGFINEPLLVRHGAIDLAQAEANVVIHELVHMTGSARHAPKGLMHPMHAQYYDKPISLDATSRGFFFNNLVNIRRALVGRS
ncbi:MAG: hypothetical protein R3B06_26140 [Kofleriaceae bacterium]